MKKKFALTLVSLASVALLAACGEVSTTGNYGSASETEIGKTLKIGFNFEETGDVAFYGTAEQKGAKLEFYFWMNQQVVWTQQLQNQFMSY